MLRKAVHNTPAHPPSYHSLPIPPPSFSFLLIPSPPPDAVLFNTMAFSEALRCVVESLVIIGLVKKKLLTAKARETCTTRLLILSNTYTGSNTTC